MSSGNVESFCWSKAGRTELRHELERWVGDHSISTEVLTWLCKEREGDFGDLVDARVLSATLSALERDHFNEIKRGGKLHDLLLDDRELVPDMLATADSETVRDTIRKLMMSGVFEELNKRSLLGRIIRVFPEMESMLTGEDERETGGADCLLGEPGEAQARTRRIGPEEDSGKHQGNPDCPILRRFAREFRIQGGQGDAACAFPAQE